MRENGEESMKILEEKNFIGNCNILIINKIR